MAGKNDITGDEIKTKTNSEKYREGWDRIFGKKYRKQEITLGDYISNLEQDMDSSKDIDNNAPLT